MAVVLNESFTGANGAAWPASTFSMHNSGSTATIDANRGRAAIGSTTGSRVLGQVVNNTRQYQEILVKVTRAADGFIAVGLNGRGTVFSSTNGGSMEFSYRIWGRNNSTTWNLERRSGVNITSLGTITTPGVGLAPTIWIRLRFSNDNILRARVWQDGLLEPLTWGFTGSADAAPLAAGNPYIAASGTTTAYTHFFDDLVIDDLLGESTYPTAEPFTASGEMPEATPFRERMVNFAATPFTASIEVPRPVIRSGPTVTAEVLRVNADLVMPTSSGAVTVYADPINSTATAPMPKGIADVNLTANVVTATATFVEPTKVSGTALYISQTMPASASVPMPVARADANYQAAAFKATAFTTMPETRADANAVASVFRATVTVVDPVISTNARAFADPMTATARTPDAVVRGASVAKATPFTASLSIFEGWLSVGVKPKINPITASAAMPDPRLETRILVSTAWLEYASGMGPNDFTSRLDKSYMYVSDIAGTFSGKALRTNTFPTESILTWNRVPATQTGEILVRVLGQQMGPVIYFDPGNWVSVGRYGTGVEVRTPSGVQGAGIYAGDLNSGYTYIRLRLNNDNYQFKAWREGVSEPAEWWATVNLPHPPAFFGIHAIENNYAFTDYFAVANNGGVAPQYTTGREIGAEPFLATVNTPDAVVRRDDTQEAELYDVQASFVEPTITTTNGVYFNADPMRVTLRTPEAFAGTPDVFNKPKPFVASSSMPDPVVWAGTNFEFEVVGAFAASTDMTTPEFSNVTHAEMRVAPMRTSAQIIYYSEEEDPWVNLLTVDQARYPGRWYQFKNLTSSLTNRGNIDAGVTRPGRGWNGTPEFGVRDPYARTGVTLDAPDYLSAADYERAPIHTPRTWEIVFRTTKTEGYQTLIGSGAEIIVTAQSGNSFTGPFIAPSLYLSDGELMLDTFSWGGRKIPGGRNMADGNWHHVVVTSGGDTEVFIDGQSTFIRYGQGGLLPFETVGAWHDGSSSFEGDIVAVAEFEGRVSRDFAINHYYAWSYTTVGRGETMRADLGLTPRNKGKGNQLRALALYNTGGGQGYQTAAGGDQKDAYGLRGVQWSGIDINKYRFVGFDSQYIDTTPFEWGPFIVFPKSVNGDEWNQSEQEYQEEGTGAPYLNDYDGSPRYIDLQNDLDDITDYDMVFFIDAPFRSEQVTWSPAGLGGVAKVKDMSQEYDRLMETFRWAIDQGVSAWVPQPQVAADLGIIDGYAMDSADSEGYFDYHAHLTDYDRNDPRSYVDRDNNNRAVIVNQIQGLTDYPTVIREDAGRWLNPAFVYSTDSDISSFAPQGLFNQTRTRGAILTGNLVGQRIDYDFWNVTVRNEGLRVGDLIEYARTGDRWIADRVHPIEEGLRDPGVVYAIDGSRPYVGTVVAKGVPRYYTGQQEVKGASADNIIALAVQPGTHVKGRPIGGKVFVYFNEARPAAMIYAAERNKNVLLTHNSGFQANAGLNVSPFDWDTRRYVQRIAYAPTTFYKTTSATRNGGTTLFKDKLDVNIPIIEEGMAEGSEIVMYEAPNLVALGTRWLAITDDNGPGDNIVRVEPMTAAVETVEPGLDASQHNTVTAAPMLGTATTISEDEGVIQALPMDVRVDILSPDVQKPDKALKATATMPDDVRVVAEGHDVVFFLPRNYVVEFYVMED